MYDMETICTAIITELQTNLPAQLDIIDADKADGITLADPLEYYLSDRKLGQYPTVIVQPAASEAVLEAEKYGLEVHGIEVFVVLVGSEDTDTLVKRVLRTVKGIQATLEANPQLDENVNWLRVVSKDYSQTMFRDDNTTKKDGRLVLEVRTTD